MTTQRQVTSVYTIRPIPSKNRVEVVFNDFRDHDAERFAAELQSAVQSAKNEDGRFDIVLDMSNSVVMPQDIAAKSEANAKWLNDNGLRKSANIIQSITQRMQVKRVTSQDSRYGFFETGAEAEEWLAS